MRALPGHQDGSATDQTYREAPGLLPRNYNISVVLSGAIFPPSTVGYTAGSCTPEVGFRV